MLPAHAAALGNTLKICIPLRRRGFGRDARHRIRAWRNHHSRAEMVRRNLGVDILPVVGTIADEGRHRTMARTKR
ncbi:hypothetical protein [Paracraurococcus ruber]|uniref:hypothetical protein n=1 Tax=Paracraurococcus ruber TaxID=77675 RepID=UPI0019617648